jgi:hypothetical protein
MERRLKTAEGKKIYKKRKETVEPVFGIMTLPALKAKLDPQIQAALHVHKKFRD